MRIYTKSGDNGWTYLPSGQRVRKTDKRLEVYGSIDELISALGVLVSMLPAGKDHLSTELQKIQSELMTLSAALEKEKTALSHESIPELLHEDLSTSWLEVSIDRMDEALPKLTHFILPGGHPAAAWAHLARSICRRAERRLVSFVDDAATCNVHPRSLTIAVGYLNRLSDYLFVLARFINTEHHIDEVPWKP